MKSRAIPVNNVFRDTTIDIWQAASRKWDHSVRPLLDMLVGALATNELSTLLRSNGTDCWLNLNGPLEHVPLRLSYDEIS